MPNFFWKTYEQPSKAFSMAVGELDLENFQNDDKTASAVIRKFEIIGEASKNIPDEIQNQYPHVPWKEMAGMRDRLIHSYFGGGLRPHLENHSRTVASSEVGYSRNSKGKFLIDKFC